MLYLSKGAITTSDRESDVIPFISRIHGLQSDVIDSNSVVAPVQGLEQPFVLARATRKNICFANVMQVDVVQFARHIEQRPVLVWITDMLQLSSEPRLPQLPLNTLASIEFCCQKPM